MTQHPIADVDMNPSAGYEPGKPLHNARVLMKQWQRELIAVEEDGGLFENNYNGSGSIMKFMEVVELLQDSDTLHRLSKTDAIEAAAMLYHISPAMQYDN